jgi:hypothetical protein
MSKTIGSFREKDFISIGKSTEAHEFTAKLKESGYTNNISTYDKTGWVPHKTLHSDMVRTEYRLHFNQPKPLHYKGPKYSTGEFKKKESVHKFT